MDAGRECSAKVSGDAINQFERKCSSSKVGSARRCRWTAGARRGGAVLDLELQEQLVGMLVGLAAELATVVGQHGVDVPRIRLEGRGDVAVHQVQADGLLPSS